MMAFYIKPPQGYMQLSTVEHIVWQRLKFLLDVSKYCHSVLTMTDLVQQLDTVAHSDCLIEGSSKDSASHFLLRLACSQDIEMEKFFVHAETELFRYRFSCMTHKELLAALRPLRRFQHQLKSHGQLSKQYRDVLNILDSLMETGNWSTLIRKFVRSENAEFIRLPFVYVLDLVRRRAVFMDHGLALVPCSKLCDVMTTVFMLLLQRGMTLARKVLPSVVNNDDRFAQLFEAIQLLFHKNNGANLGHYSRDKQAIRCEDIDMLVDCFPPCMSHLHRQLRLKHRLDHRARIQYTLFLKELGLPIHEAIQFWKQEYTRLISHSAAGRHSCQHSWKTDSRRYTYSIRHLYGLEGARINYRGHSCHSLQNELMSGTGQGGCPFRHSDRRHLIRQLSLDSLPFAAVRRMLKLSSEESGFSAACHIYLLTKLQRASSWKRQQPVKSLTRLDPPHQSGYALTSNDGGLMAEGIKIDINNSKGQHSMVTNNGSTISLPSSGISSYCSGLSHHDIINTRHPPSHHHSQACVSAGSQLSHGQVRWECGHIPPDCDMRVFDELHLTQGQRNISSPSEKTGSRQMSLSSSQNETIPAESILLEDCRGVINKPIDFYHTYKTLAESVRNISR